MNQLGNDGLPLTREGDRKRMHAVIRFTRDVKFPRFSMAQGERWSFVVYGNLAAMLNAIRAGERFEFAGGQGLPGDAEIIYEGPPGRQYLEAAGCIPPSKVEGPATVAPV